MIFKRGKSRGQAAVEAMYAIPVMLLVYLVGAQMWSMTWNAQYAHVKARLDAHVEAGHKPCFSNEGQQLSPTPHTATATTIADNFYGSRYTVTTQRVMKATYKIECR